MLKRSWRFRNLSWGEEKGEDEKFPRMKRENKTCLRDLEKHLKGENWKTEKGQEQINRCGVVKEQRKKLMNG